MAKVIEMANNKKPVTLKDVFGDDYKMNGEKDEVKEEVIVEEKPVKKTTTKKTSARKTAKKA